MCLELVSNTGLLPGVHLSRINIYGNDKFCIPLFSFCCSFLFFCSQEPNFHVNSIMFKMCKKIFLFAYLSAFTFFFILLIQT